MDEIIRKMNLNDILDKFTDYIFDRNILYHDSIDSYYSGKEPSFWRKVMFYSRFIALIIMIVKCGLSVLFPNSTDQLSRFTLDNQGIDDSVKEKNEKF